MQLLAKAITLSPKNYPRFKNTLDVALNEGVDLSRRKVSRESSTPPITTPNTTPESKHLPSTAMMLCPGLYQVWGRGGRDSLLVKTLRSFMRKMHTHCVILFNMTNALQQTSVVINETRAGQLKCTYKISTILTQQQKIWSKQQIMHIQYSTGFFPSEKDSRIKIIIQGWPKLLNQKPTVQQLPLNIFSQKSTHS